MNKPDEVYLNEKQVSEMTGIALSTLRNWRFQRKGILYTKPTKLVRYKLQDVLDFMNSGIVEVEND